MTQLINFIIIEDVERQREYLKSWLKTTRLDLNFVADFSNHFDAYAFLLSKDTPAVDLIFLDIELPGKGDGLTLLKQLHSKLNPHPKVIIISGNDYMLEVLQQVYTVSWYILKPLDEDKLSQAIDIVAEDIKQMRASSSKPLTTQTLYPTFIEFGGMLIPIKDIMFFESRNSDKILNRQGGEKITDRISMEELERKLSSANFIRVHESYIVNSNPKYLHSIDKKRTAYTIKCPKTGTLYPIPISQKYRHKFDGI